MKQNLKIILALAMLLPPVGHGTAAEAPAKGFYKQPPLFSTAPGETVSSQLIGRFGPVGIGIELVHPAFMMKVANVEKGSPAEATGKLKKGQFIETINGQILADSEYLFIKAGGFSDKNPPGWKSPLIVMKRAAK